jgi:hypothetical protein
MGHPIKAYRKVTWRVNQFFENNPQADMSKPPRELPPFPVVINNFRKAVTKDIVGGRKRVPLEVYLQRITECTNCIFRQGKRCSHPGCGCYLGKKCWWATEKCPNKDSPRWVEWTESGV